MPKSQDRGKGYGKSKQLEALDKLLEPDWDEPSTTVNIHVPTPTHTMSEGLKHMKPTKEHITGAAIIGVIAAVLELLRQLGVVSY